MVNFVNVCKLFFEENNESFKLKTKIAIKLKSENEVPLSLQNLAKVDSFDSTNFSKRR
jgi:hypothetical protein